MEQQKSKKSVIKIIIAVVLIIGTVAAFVFSHHIYGEDSVFNQSISNNPVLNFLFNKIVAVIETVQVITIAYVVSLLVKLLLKKSLKRNARGITIAKLLSSFLKYVIAIVAVLIILSIWGVDTTTLIASAGILGLVIGLGAQTLIADIISGMFIVFEGDYQVGDIIVIDDWRGTVEEIGIRTTRLIDAGGNRKIINNSDIRSLVNQTQELSLAKCIIGTEYGDSIERIEAVIRDNLPVIREHIPAIIEGPIYKGVDALNTSSVDLLFVAKCKETDIYQVQRDLNRELKLMFDRNNINVPFPQVTLNHPPEFDKKESNDKE
ncbi:MAG: mechanosensitive ion channel family protein [Clostridiales bacterium]|nr:mechanosensitive ion channel family protein [Clostridiales bacterium]